MPTRKGKGQETARAHAQVALPAESFPFARYTSVVGVHTSLLAFSALVLPATSPPLNIFAQWDFSSSTSSKPERDILQALTENPVRTVAWMCAGAIVLQGWWATWIKKWANESQAAKKADSAEVAQQRLERKEKPLRSREDVTAYTQAAAMTLAGSVVFYAMTVLFGAPLLSHPLQTYAMSLLLSVLTVLPPAYTLGIPSLGSDSPSLVSRLTWVRLFAELSPRTPVERALVYPAIGAVTGSWLGAIPIGLDWERPWQAWPLTPTFGAVGGYIAGSLVALVVSATFELAQADVAHQNQTQKLGKSKKKS
ncbi:PIG-F-domain-containing protein [Lentinus tigrinus ALCF2SS1-7]|uniref:PIG-F-domain-containing protein n=1 Tax=Lentinus tigrinus ALCF2SS1-6 TaxID=1328759 RepID=A0A5C2SEK6_9APHY|nr:PIG-F-domain-containing protein [Lentinus tigrinus ALCF2SS1-6]RPD76167.1 PIG-F-domain-containing protein [Lentinus tigrinus ALCF2SS1-7]